MPLHLRGAQDASYWYLSISDMTESNDARHLLTTSVCWEFLTSGCNVQQNTRVLAMRKGAWSIVSVFFLFLPLWAMRLHTVPLKLLRKPHFRDRSSSRQKAGLRVGAYHIPWLRLSSPGCRSPVATPFTRSSCERAFWHASCHCQAVWCHSAGSQQETGLGRALWVGDTKLCRCKRITSYSARLKLSVWTLRCTRTGSAESRFGEIHLKNQQF